MLHALAACHVLRIAKMPEGKKAAQIYPDQILYEPFILAGVIRASTTLRWNQSVARIAHRF